MSGMEVKNLQVALSNLELDVGQAQRRRQHEAHLGIKELEVLRDVDFVAPAALAQVGEPLVESYRGNITNGDLLRLPPPTRLDGETLRASVRRVLGAPIDRPGGSPKARSAEAKMHRVLGAIDSALTTIEAHANAEHLG